MWKMGLKVYCASDIYLQHISLDGKIYRRNILEEKELHEKIMYDEKHQYEVELKNELIKKYVCNHEEVSKVEIKKSTEEKKEQKIDEKKIEPNPLVQCDFILLEYLQFLKDHPYEKIPPRPSTPTLKVMDSITHHIIDQTKWDAAYGKWRKYIENKMGVK
jgi:hypothetical protein